MVSIKAWLLKALKYCPNPTITDSTLETELTSILGNISADITITSRVAFNNDRGAYDNVSASILDVTVVNYTTAYNTLHGYDSFSISGNGVDTSGWYLYGYINGQRTTIAQNTSISNILSSYGLQITHASTATYSTGFTIEGTVDF